MWFKTILLTLSLGLLLANTMVFSQGGKTAAVMAGEHYQDGEKALLKKNYKQAIRHFSRALKVQPSLVPAHRMLAICYDLTNQFEKAISHYEKIIEEEPFFSRVMYYQLGEAHYKLENYEKALEYFHQFEFLQDLPIVQFKLLGDREKFEESELLERLQRTIRACEVSLDSLEFLNVTEVINLGSGVNSRQDDYFPFLSNDQKHIYFTRRKDERADENLYQSSFIKNKWRKSGPVAGFNTENHEGMSTLIRDGRRIFFTACNREEVNGPCDIWEALVSDDFKVTDSAPLRGLINSDKWDGQASINCDGSILYFASIRKDGIGGSDIYVSERQSDGSWSFPKNLGPKINTKGDEEAPFITDDGKTLYFSSTGHLGRGEQDIFMSWLNESTGEWSEPINLGPPVNTPFRELGFFLSADGRTGYFASDRPKGHGQMDIYKFELAKQLHSEPITFVEGHVKDSVIHIPIQTTVKVNGRPDIQTDENGRFFICMGADEVLDLEVDQKRYKPYHNQFPIPVWENKHFYGIELLLQPTLSFIALADQKRSEFTAKKAKARQEYTHTVFFDFDKATLEPDEISKLDEFVSPLKVKNVQRVEIIGFADDVGADVYNLKLSEERAKQIALFLIDNNLVVDQIYLEGKGEIADDKPKEKNRKVEVKVFTLE